MTTIDLDEWGVDVYDAEEIRAFMRPARPRSRKIESAAAYERAVRRLAPWAALVDYRLIRAVWRRPAVRPTEWIDPDDRAGEWLSYWETVALRPDRIGSCYNPPVEAAAWAWARRMGPRAVPLATLWLPHTRDRERALVELSRKGLQAHHISGAWSTADLRRLAHLSRAALAWLGESNVLHHPQRSWAAIAREHASWARYRDPLMRLRIPATEWRGIASAIPAAWLARIAEAADCPVGCKALWARWHEVIEYHVVLQQDGAVLSHRDPAVVKALDALQPLLRRQSTWRLLPGAAPQLHPERCIWALACQRERARRAEIRAERTLRRMQQRSDYWRFPPLYPGWVRDKLEYRRSQAREAWLRKIRRAKAWRARARDTRLVLRINRHHARRMNLRPAGGGLVGWRCWRFIEKLLVSPQRGTRWSSTVLTAEEGVSASQIVRNQSGIHACWSRKALRSGSGVPDVIGRVIGSGQYASGPEGWRAERVEIDVLYAPALMIPAIRAAYPGVAVRPLPRVWGV